MVLPLDQVERFYRIWFALLNYVNDHEHLVPSFPKSNRAGPVEPATVKVLRDRLWADDTLREGFIAENPAGLDATDVALVASWADRVAGSFYVFRYLKKYTVFLAEGSPTHAYGVLGLVSPFEEVLGPDVPIYVQAVLLPFEGKITYDSLLLPYNIYFGGGIRAGLRDSYRDAQEREGIITSLDPPGEEEIGEARSAIAGRNAKLLIAFRKDLAASSLSAKMLEEHGANIADFAESYLLAQNPPRGLLELTPADVETYLAARTAKANPVSLKRFIRFLWNTGRIDPDAEALLTETLKRVRK